MCVCVYLKHQPINAYEKVLKGHTLCTSVHLNLYYRSLFFISEKYFLEFSGKTTLTHPYRIDGSFLSWIFTSDKLTLRFKQKLSLRL